MNPNGHHLIDYVLSSNDDMNLIAFIIPRQRPNNSLLNRPHFVKFQNEQYLHKTGRTLYERYMYMTDKKLRDKFFEITSCLLEESYEIYDIKTQTEIDKLLLFLDVEQNEQEIRTNSNIVVLNDVERIIKEIKEDKQKKFDYESDFKKLLRYSLENWQKTDSQFSNYKMQLILTGHPIFVMAIQIIEGEEDKFIFSFLENVQKLFGFYANQYDPKDLKQSIVQKDMLFLFHVAIKHGHNNIVEYILNSQIFKPLKFELHSHNRVTKHNLFAARKLLDRGYELTHVPPLWITEQVLEDFLDSRITHYDGKLIKLDISFLTNLNETKYKINGRNDVTDYLLFNEHTENLEYILKNEHLKSLLQHPVVSTYINIKAHKYKLIHYLHFYFFLFIFMLLTVCLSGRQTDHYFVIACVSSTMILCLWEYFHYKWFYKSLNQYLSVNKIELLIIAFWLIIIIILSITAREWLDLFSLLALLFIMFAPLLPLNAVPMYIKTLKHVSIFLLKFVCFLFFSYFAFRFSLDIAFFRNSTVNENTSTSTVTSESEDILSISTKNKNVDFEEIVNRYFLSLLDKFFGASNFIQFIILIIILYFLNISFIYFKFIVQILLKHLKEMIEKGDVLDYHYLSNQFINSGKKWKAFYQHFG